MGVCRRLKLDLSIWASKYDEGVMFGDFPNVNEVKLVTESIKKLESIHANTIMYSAMLCMIDAWKYGKNDLPQDSIDLFDEFKERISALEAELAKAREEIKTLKDAPPNVHKEIEKTVKFLDGNDWQNCKNEFFQNLDKLWESPLGQQLLVV